MEVKAWKSGLFSKRSVTYGIRIGAENRDRHFRREWTSIAIQTDDGSAVEVPLTAGFWRHCPEMRHAFFGDWFTNHRLVPWPPGRPPTFDLEFISGNRFTLKRLPER